MMYSPESYRQIHLKNKNKDELLEEIRQLKSEIERLKLLLESPETVETRITPSEEVRIWMYRQYLDSAVALYREAGGNYQPSASELESAAFQNNIPKIKTLIFSIGDVFDGLKTAVISFEGEKVYCTKEKSRNLQERNAQTIVLPESKSVFLNILETLYIGEWLPHYTPRRFGYLVIDGIEWHLKIEYTDNLKPFERIGENDYPYNFEQLKELLTGVIAQKEKTIF